MLGRADELTSGRLLARNVFLNLLGWVLPALAALVAIPALVGAMGEERFALLTLAWALVGYFSLFDLGIGRALTQVLAERVGAADERDSPALTWTALWLLLPLGLACALGLAAAAHPLAYRVLNVPPALREETVVALRWLAVAVPFMVLTSGLRAVLEAGQRFRVINALRVPLGVATFLGPLLVQLVSHRLPAAVGVLVAARAVLFALHAVAVFRAVPRLRHPIAPSRAAVARLWGIAGWMTVSSVVSPVLVSVDRFVIGAVLPVAAVAYYATASEIATKMWLFTAALQPVVFPALATTIAREPTRAAALFDRGVRITFLALVLPASLMVLFAREGLALWLGAGFAMHGAQVLQGLAIAVLVNAIGQMAYAVVQSSGRADISGRLHVVELPIYLALLWWLLGQVGLVGVALAWLARMLVDTVLLLLAVRAVLPAARRAVHRALALVAAGTVALGACALPMPLALRLVVAAVLAALVAFGGWRRLLSGRERRACGALLGRIAPARPLDVESPATGA